MIDAIVDTLDKMGIKVYISGNSGNKEIVTHQQKIFMVMKSLKIEFEPVDIAGPGMDDEKDIMRAKGKKKEGQRHALPPQIFNGEKYCGDYEDFDLANEDDELEEFLGIPRKTPKANPDAAAKQNGHAETNGEAPSADAAPSGEQTAESAPSEATSPPSGDAAAAPSSAEAPTSEPAAPAAPAGEAPAADKEGGDEEEEEEGEEEDEEEDYEEGEDEA